MKNKKVLREWLLFSIMLAFGIFLLQFTATVASAVPADWQISASILSDLDPDADFRQKKIVVVQPVLPEIMTPPAWDLELLLTPEPADHEQAIIVPVADFAQSPTPAVTKVTNRLASEPANQANQGESGEVNPTDQWFSSPTTSVPDTQVTSTPTLVVSSSNSTPVPAITSTSTQLQPSASPTPTLPGSGKPTKEPRPTKEPGPGNGGGGGKGNKNP